MSERVKPHSEQGFWWSPEKADNRIVGTVSYGPCEGFEIDLVGSLTGTALEFGTPSTLKETFDVWGLTVRQKPITLFQAHQANTTIPLPGWPTSRIEAAQGVIGGHYRSWDEVLVHTVDVQFEHLPSWSQMSGITEMHDASKKSHTVVLAPPNGVEIAEKEGIHIQVVPLISTTHPSHGLQIKEWSQLQLKSESARPFRTFDSLIRSFQKFLSLAVGESAHPVRVLGVTPNKVADCDDKPIWREVEIIRSSSRSSARDEVRPDAMLFTLRDLQDAQKGVFARFLETEPLLQPVFDLFFPTYFFDLPPPQELLNMAHALEAFHRATVGGEYQTDVEYEGGLKQTLLNAVPQNLDPDFRASLKRKMDFLHQFSLKKRLKDILRRFDSVVTPFVGKRDAFIGAVTEARNRLVHASTASPAIDYAKCWGFAQQLGLVLEVGILAEIGFKEDAINGIIHRGKRADLIMNNVGNGITIY